MCVANTERNERTNRCLVFIKHLGRKHPKYMTKYASGNKYSGYDNDIWAFKTCDAPFWLHVSSARETPITSTAALQANWQAPAVATGTWTHVSPTEQVSVIDPRHHPSSGLLRSVSNSGPHNDPFGGESWWEVGHVSIACPKIQTVWPFHIHLS